MKVKFCGLKEICEKWNRNNIVKYLKILKYPCPYVHFPLLSLSQNTKNYKNYHRRQFLHLWWPDPIIDDVNTTNSILVMKSPVQIEASHHSKFYDDNARVTNLLINAFVEGRGNCSHRRNMTLMKSGSVILGQPPTMTKQCRYRAKNDFVS